MLQFCHARPQLRRSLVDTAAQPLYPVEEVRGFDPLTRAGMARCSALGVRCSVFGVPCSVSGAHPSRSPRARPFGHPIWAGSSWV